MSGPSEPFARDFANDSPPKKTSYVPVPEGMEVPMCFCGDLCRIRRSDDYSDTYGRRIFICDNYEYDPPKNFRQGYDKVYLLFIQIIPLFHFKY